MLKFRLMLLSALAVCMSSVSAFAAGVVDYSAISTSVTAEITPALTAVVPIAGTLLAIGVGWKFVKRFVK